ncbi:1-(5-phosphoribosyl)-5-[(5-phosphoribosylamino)methylideneamino] imidazole-4-carboxamide isomerase [Blastopirellula retiformator]|uniref:1-(5-phosphoribosyl)-5-[(5-phosphoribosylamino)methylideneamino] imidazole-4-carboxamide isomerase n=1 Tax=Blastopirellula retiformator TaxID=2527970 RepID=A0A5C5VND3_9BACT|nr:1-(5-phosphoribosyl)-5-[(5-phosphoribosylamino)methylideneamino] imidazole-4-carboxamide isomerase [Blastopirellula retiformator]
MRGVGGVRNRYRPIESRLCSSADPGDVAAAMASRFGFRDIYVADLDAIVDQSPQWESWRKITGAGLQLHLDAHLAFANDCQRVLDVLGEEGIASLIVGLETLGRWEDLREIANAFGGRATFSLDLRHGRPLKIVGGAIRAEEIAEKAVDCGVRRVVLLDLVQVGEGRGTGTETLCRELASQYEEIEWITGGGIRSLKEIAWQRTIGASRVLVSSALHQDEKILMGSGE